MLSSSAPIWLGSPSLASSDQASVRDKVVSTLKGKVSQLEGDGLYLKHQQEDADQLKVLFQRITGMEDRVLNLRAR